MAVEISVNQLPGAAPLAVSWDEVTSIFEAVLAHEQVDRLCLVDVTVADDVAMAELNEEWRGVQGPTDVISVECERPDDPDLAPGEPCSLGDIALAPAFIAAQAPHFNNSPAQETRLLLIHGLLHLLGYDHVTDEEAAIMEPLEDALLAQVSGQPVASATTTRHRHDPLVVEAESKAAGSDATPQDVRSQGAQAQEGRVAP